MSEAAENVTPITPEPETTPTDWRSQLGEYADSPALKDTKSVEALAKQFVDQQGYLGRNIQIPDAEATSERWDEFYSKVAEKAPDLMRKPDFEKDPNAKDDLLRVLGKPKEASEYALPDGFELPDEMLSDFREEAFEEGLTREQFQKRMDRKLTKEKALYDSQMEEFNTEKAKLQQEWGLAAERKTKDAERVLNTFFPELGMNIGEIKPVLVRRLSELADALGSDGPQIVNQDGGEMSMTPDEARSKAQDVFHAINKGVENGDFYQGSDEYNRLVRKRHELLKQANQEK